MIRNQWFEKKGAIVMGCQDAEPAGPRAVGPRLEASALERIGSYLEGHLGDSVSLDDLAGLASVSRFHFARCFRSSTGESPMAFLRRLRVERAKLLLARGNPISDVAVELGFYDQSHLTRHFTRIVGTSPGRYVRWVRRVQDVSRDGPPQQQQGEQT